MANNIKDLDIIPSNSLVDVIEEVSKNTSVGIDRVRAVLALRMNQYVDIELTPKEISKIAEQFMYIEDIGSSSNLVMICDKKSCLYRTRCPLYNSDKCPEGRECLHENKILIDTLNRYMSSLEINPENYPEMVLVNQLVEYELLEYRCNAILSNNHTDMRMSVVAGFDKETGMPVLVEQTSHALTIKDSIFKKKMLILQELTATRKEKYKKQVALKEVNPSLTKSMSSLKEKVLSRNKDKNTSIDNEISALEDIDKDDSGYYEEE